VRSREGEGDGGRWPNKDELTFAAIRHFRETNPVEVPDTGSLRGDLLAALHGFSDGRNAFTVVMAATFAGLQSSSGITPAEVRARVIDSHPIASHEVYRRARERGELDLDAVPAAVLALPFDLMRHDLLMTLKPIPAERITAIVDELFLPLLTAYRRQDASQPER